MSWFQLDPYSIVERVNASRRPVEVPSLGASLLRGVIGFTVVSVAGFTPWALAGGWFRPGGEIGLYVTCAAVFIGMSGVLLHRLIIGPGSLVRFYKLFSIAFAEYAAAWIIAWILLRNEAGSIVGLLAGTTAMGWVFVRAFDAQETILKVIAVLFLLNAAGYFGGGWVEENLMRMRWDRQVAMLMCGVCYGVGFGAGLGLAFYFCQARTRELMEGGKG